MPEAIEQQNKAPELQPFINPQTPEGQLNIARAQSAKATKSSFKPSTPLAFRPRNNAPTSNNSVQKNDSDTKNTPQSTEGQLNSLRNKEKNQANSNDDSKSGNIKNALAAVKAAGGVKNAAKMASQEGTRSLLRTMWFAVKPSFGLSLFYVWFHYIMRYLAKSDFFSRFGSFLPKSKGMRFFGEEFLEKRLAEITFIAMMMITFGAFVVIAFPIYITVIRPDIGIKLGLKFLTNFIGF